MVGLGCSIGKLLGRSGCNLQKQNKARGSGGRALFVMFSGIPGPCHSFLHHFQACSHLRPEKSSRNHLRHQEPNVCSPASGRSLPLVADRVYITPQMHETPAGLPERSENSPQDLQQVPLKAWVSKCLRSPPLIGEKDFEELIRWNDRNVGRNFYITAASETQT